MARPVDPLAPYRVSLHVTNGYTYANTQPAYTDPDTGKIKHRCVHWGRLGDNLQFIPGFEYYNASPEERRKLVFPPEWDLSLIDQLATPAGQNKPNLECCRECRNLLYGDVWLIEQIAEKTGLREDLEIVFDGNSEAVSDVLTLAMFPYLTKYTYNRVARWQLITKAPSSRLLTPSVITKFTQSITERHRMELLKLRAARMSENELCAVDSTSRSAYGDELADIRWGKNKDQLPLAQTNDVVVYSLSNHMPVYYRQFAGNTPDSRSLDIILSDLDGAGFKNPVLITDRGYDTLHTLDKYISRGQPFITCAITSHKLVASEIRAMGDFGVRPENMQLDPDERIFYKQYDLSYAVKGSKPGDKAPDRLKLNLYFDIVRRSYELLDLELDISSQGGDLEGCLNNKTVMEDIGKIKRDCRYYSVKADSNGCIESYALDEKKVAKARSLSGFFANITHGLDYDAMEAYRIYHLRDEQEKYFQQMKDQMVSDRQRNWSEEGKTGRNFILFSALIISSHVRYIWRSTKLHEKFKTSLDILDQMRPIRMVENVGQPQIITPFIGSQVDICEAFGFAIPDGCAPIAVAQRNLGRKRGRPRKQLPESSN